MTTLASTMTPMAMAIPPRLMMLAFKPTKYMAENDSSTPTGSVSTATSALRRCSRNTRQMITTTAISSSSFQQRSVLTARSMRADRS